MGANPLLDEGKADSVKSGLQSFLLGLQGVKRVAVCVALLGSCTSSGVPDPSAVSTASEEEERPLLAGISPDEFPQQAEFELWSGDDWLSTQIFLEPSVPVQLWVKALGNEVSQAYPAWSPWGAPSTLSDEQSVAPLFHDGALLMQVGDRQMEFGQGASMFAPELGELKLAFLPGEEVPEKIRVGVAWGVPAVEYDPALRPVSVVNYEPEVFYSGVIKAEDKWVEIGPVEHGDRFWIDDPRNVAIQGKLYTTGFGERTEVNDLDVAVAVPGFAPFQLLARIGGDRGKVIPVVKETVFVASQDGTLELCVNGPQDEDRSTKTAWSQAKVAVGRLPRIGTAMEMLPWSAYTLVQDVVVGVDELDFVSVGLSARSGELLRVEVDGTLERETGLHSSDGTGLLNAASEDGGWLIPGGRQLAAYLRVGEVTRELRGDEVFYSPDTGPVYVAINTCSWKLDSEDTSSECVVETEGWRGEWSFRVGVSAR